MKKRDRKNTWDERKLVAAPEYKSRVMVNGQLGTVEDPGFTEATIRLDSGEVVKVPHEQVQAAK